MTQLEKTLWIAITTPMEKGKIYPEILDMVQEYYHEEEEFAKELERMKPDVFCWNKENLQCALTWGGEIGSPIDQCNTCIRLHTYLKNKFPELALDK